MEDKPDGRADDSRARLLAGRFSIFSTSGRRLFSSSGGRLIAAAALLHVALAFGLFWAGRAQIAPSFLDRDAIITNSDSYQYRSAAVRMVEILKKNGLRAWAAEPERTHVKLISLQFAVLGPVFGYSALSAEPFNLFCYVLIVALVLLLGREVGGRRVGLLAAGIVAVWPTFLLHTTQFLKDPLFIAAALALILIVTTWLTRNYTWGAAARMGALMGGATVLLLLVRVKFGAIIYVFVFFGFALLVVRQWLERRVLYRNMIFPLLILCAGALLPFYLAAGHQKLKQYPSGQGGRQKSAPVTGRQLPGVITYARAASDRPKMSQGQAGQLSAALETAVIEIESARYKYNTSYPESGSAIDRNVEYKNLKNLILYLPRAVAIGFWSPFPAMWFGAGRNVGSAGRLMSGVETLLMYLCQLLVLVGIRRAPRCLPAWLLLSITLFGVTVLGLVVSNVGTLYRFRFVFWMLLIILGVKGFESIAATWRGRAP
ncbi:MAG TPA: hypothetical protein VGB61_09600, partial [Pyrinomonadaceae bacterium]